MQRYQITLILTWLYASMGSSAIAATYPEALNFFNKALKTDLASLLSTTVTVDRNGHCVSVTNQQSSEARAFVAIPAQSEFGSSVFIGFEHFKESESDQQIVANAETSYRRYWGRLYENEDGVFQSAYDASYANHYQEYRKAKTSDGEDILIRKYFADRAVFGPNRRWHIAAFDAIELCWIKLSDATPL